MRDRLVQLHQLHHQLQSDSEGFSTVELEDPSLASHGPDQDLDGVLEEARQIRLEIQQIRSDVGDLRDVNFQTLNRTTHADAAKRDSNAIGAEIKRRGEAALQRLHMMNSLGAELERRRGGSDPAARIARTQYRCLSAALQEAMSAYNQAEMSHREACRRQIRRQMEVVGREVSEEELEEMAEGEELTLFSAQLTGGTTRAALLQIESRQRELLELQGRVERIQELFLDVALLVEEQGGAADNIQRHVQTSGAGIQEGIFRLERATATAKDTPFKKMLCGCFPCYHS